MQTSVKPNILQYRKPQKSTKSTEKNISEKIVRYGE